MGNDTGGRHCWTSQQWHPADGTAGQASSGTRDVLGGTGSRTGVATPQEVKLGYYCARLNAFSPRKRESTKARKNRRWSVKNTFFVVSYFRVFVMKQDKRGDLS
jgi:hypothetical protein